jgi:hypothetical protein
MNLAYFTYCVFIIVYVVGMNNTLAREGQERNRLCAYFKKFIRKIFCTISRKNAEFRKCLLLRNENVK